MIAVVRDHIVNVMSRERRRRKANAGYYGLGQNAKRNSSYGAVMTMVGLVTPDDV